MEIGDINGIAITQLNMGNTAINFNHAKDAGEYYRESLKSYESLGNKWGIANCLGNLGNVAYIEEDYSKSMELHERSLVISAGIGDGEGEVICNMNLGRDANRLENSVKSFDHYREALKKAALLGLVPLALSALRETVKQMIEEEKSEYAALALFFMQKHIDSISHNEKADIKILLDDALNELSDEKKAEIRAEAQSLSLPAIAEIILGAT
jgi:tetratricopeptide (TPR) repeat protein